MRRLFGRCAMVAPGPRLGGDFVSTFRGVLDGNPMDHGEVPNIFPQTWKKGTHRADRMGGERIGAGGSRTRIADRSWRPTRGTGWVARGSELGGRHADWRLEWLGATGGLHNGGAYIGAGPGESPGPDTESDRLRFARYVFATTFVSQKYAPLKSCLTNVGSVSCSQQPSTRDSAMYNSKETNFATIQPMFFCPYFLGSVLVEFNNIIIF